MNFSELRIISLVPSQTELLYYLGLEKNIVACTRFCIHPREKTRNIPKIGGTKDFDFDKIEALKPTLILGNKEENYKEGIEQLQEKYPTWISDIVTLEDAFDAILEIGKLTNTIQKAAILVVELKSRFQEVKAIFPLQKVAYFIWKKPWMVAGKDNFINEMLELMGLQNVFLHKASRYPAIDEDELKELAPAIILLSSEPYPFKERHIATFKAICPDAIVKIVDGELFSWYGSRLLLSPAYFTALQKELV